MVDPVFGSELKVSVAQQRKLLLANFAITESELNRLRGLPPTEARWRIKHEHEVQMDWTRRRRDFVVEEVFGHMVPTVSGHLVDGTDVRDQGAGGCGPGFVSDATPPPGAPAAHRVTPRSKDGVRTGRKLG